VSLVSLLMAKSAGANYRPRSAVPMATDAASGTSFCGGVCRMGRGLPGFVAAPWSNSRGVVCSLKAYRWVLAQDGSLRPSRVTQIRSPRVNKREHSDFAADAMPRCSKLTISTLRPPQNPALTVSWLCSKYAAQRLKKLPLYPATPKLSSRRFCGAAHEAYRTLIWPMGGN